MVARDIDIEIYCDLPTIDPRFAIMSELARQPVVWKVRFSNALDGPDQRLYWQLRYRVDDAEVWKRSGRSICGCSATIIQACVR